MWLRRGNLKRKISYHYSPENTHTPEPISLHRQMIENKHNKYICEEKYESKPYHQEYL